MKKVIFLVFGLLAAFSMRAENTQQPSDGNTGMYILKEDGYYHYNGEPVDDVYMDFSDLTAADAYYTTGTTHKDTLFTFMETLGMYKWCYYASRTITGGDTYGPVAWNSGTSENGKNGDIKTSAPEKLPAVYFPEIKTGVKQLVVEGWTNNGGDRTLIVDYEDAEGKWKTVKGLGVDPYYATMKTNTYSSDTVNINNAQVKRIRFWRNSNDWQFLTKVQIIAMPDTETGVAAAENAESKAVKYIENGQLYIRRNGQIYSAQGCKL